jgi:sugar phosphate isomerase/epimerase
MKFAFSTLGCPGWSWDEIVSSAKDLGYDGIELRGIENEMFVPSALPFSPENINDTQQRLEKLNIQIPCVTSFCKLHDLQNIEVQLNEGIAYIEFAAKMEIPYVRVLGDTAPAPGIDINDSYVRENIEKLVEIAATNNVTLLIETNGVYAESSRLSKLLSSINNNNVGVLWDIHHPFRYFNESIETTWANIGKYVKHVHVKDSLVNDGKVVYKMTGSGDVPVSEAIKLLKDNGFNGFVTLEWVKRWNMELEEPGIVFSKFIYFGREI